MHVQPQTRTLAALAAAVMTVSFAALPALAQSASGAQPPAVYYPPPGYYPPQSYYLPAPVAAYTPPPESPPPSDPPRGHHEHDGFYVSLRAGFDYLHASDGRLGATETIAGLGLAMDYALGIAVAPNLVLFANATMNTAMNPTHRYAEKSETLTNTEMSLFGFGTGVAYYIEPMNVQLAGALSIAGLMLRDTTGSSSSGSDFTDLGWGASLTAGKEWWVSSNWALGAAAAVRFASMKLADYDARLTATSIALLFTATYN